MFGDKKKTAALILGPPEAPGAPMDGGPDDAGAPDAGLESAGSQLIDAIHAKDAAGVVDALKALWEMLEAAPHEEGGESEG